MSLVAGINRGVSELRTINFRLRLRSKFLTSNLYGFVAFDELTEFLLN